MLTPDISLTTVIVGGAEKKNAAACRKITALTLRTMGLRRRLTNEGSLTASTMPSAAAGM
ncbi:hypothetical protein OHA61_04840 [Streptomyces sp. NBC_00885]|nr:hypothetical protein OHA61_04840 [Streptomyces sp. NBC_00885]